ncbi:alanine racemase [Heyndrickxia shackletonii]|uniref:Alanine racemase n=1 Tax=Heyndrickxia shackletonii TaxID=157838 RepID=A0A0Q3TBU1_9BACI|nr:alanine racemase [Heyndrickxia shackletonii]KQL51049.1 alanine racemase [Heyndrickxia shackletonii]NEZ00735.1 alanine racemase [Heyndrickxia shackletonii]
MNSPFYRDTWAEIQLDYLKENVLSVREHLPKDVEIFAVVKANGYGHGDVQVAKAALEAGAHGLAVAFLDEALVLRKNGIDVPVLVLGATRHEDAIIAAKNKISLTVFQKEWLEKAMLTLGNDMLSVHVKCDTGMGRIGIRNRSELKDIVNVIENSHNLIFEGIFTHFATADELNTDYYETQLHRFMEMVNALDIKPRYIHCANSAATLRFPQSGFNAVRLGIAMYGLSPSDEMKNLVPFPLKEVFSLHTKIVHVKRLSPGESISYGATYQTKEEEWIATLPIGYADGWIRKLQGQVVLVEGKEAPIVGRICMDQCMIRLPYYMPVGTNVTLIGEQEGHFISINDIAYKLETINYEIPCTISKRVPRVYIKNGEVAEIRNGLLDS